MNGFKTAALMTLMMILFLFVGNLLGGETGLMIAFVFSIILNFGSYWFSDKIVLTLYKAKEVSPKEAPELHRMVEDLSQRAMIPKPRVYVMPSDTPNAFATGRNPENGVVAVTTGIIKILNREELEGVIAHELAHIKNRDILVSTIAATLVGTITMIARLAGWTTILGGGRDRDGGGLSDLLLMILAPIVAILIQLAISRSREYMADETGAEITGKPMGLASALNKLEQAGKAIPMRNAETSSAHMFIVNPLSGKSLMKMFSTHPPIEQRVNRLREIANGRR